MEATISADNVKALQSSLTCLGKLSESVNWLASRKDPSQRSQSQSQPSRPLTPSVRLSAINSTSSAICAVELSDSFFDGIRLRSATDKVECEIKVKPFLNSLKTASSSSSSSAAAASAFTSNGDRRKLERCQLSIIDGGPECRIIVRLHHAQGVVRTHKLTYEQKSALFPSDRPGDGSVIVMSAQMALAWLHHFTSMVRGAEISLWCTRDSCSVRSKSDEYASGDKNRKARQTQVTPDIADFSMYDIREDAYITFALKEFRAIASLAEAVNEPLELRFTRAGEPLFVDVVSSAYADVSVSASAATPSIRCEMVLATSDQQAPDVMDNSSAANQTNGHHAPAEPAGAAASRAFSNGPPELTPRDTRASQPPQSAPAQGARPSQVPRESTPRAAAAAAGGSASVPASAPARPARRSRDQYSASSPPPAPSMIPSNGNGAGPSQRASASASAVAAAAVSVSEPSLSQPIASQDDTSNGLFLGGAMMSSTPQPRDAARGQHAGRANPSSSSRMPPPPAIPNPPPVRPVATASQRAANSEAAIARLTAVHHRRDLDFETLPESLPASRDPSVAGRGGRGGEEEEGDGEGEAFDYGGALDEVEKGIERGDIQVHGSQMQQGRDASMTRDETSRTEDESRQRSAGAIEVEERDDDDRDDDRDDAGSADEQVLPGSGDELELDELPATQPSSSAKGQQQQQQQKGGKRGSEREVEAGGRESEAGGRRGGGGGGGGEAKRFRPLFE